MRKRNEDRRVPVEQALTYLREAGATEGELCGVFLGGLNGAYSRLGGGEPYPGLPAAPGPEIFEELARGGPEGFPALYEQALEATGGAGRRKGGGIFYTPLPLARGVAAKVLEPLLKERDREEILALRILDPAAGGGSFLLAAAESLAAALVARSERPDKARFLATGCLQGMDLDESALEAARLTFWHWSGGAFPSLRAADALEPDAAGVADFDACLGNPPWVSFSGREAEAITGEERDRLAAFYPAFRRWPSLQGAFLERSVRVLRPGGRLGMVVPAQMAHLPRYGAVRAVLRSLGGPFRPFWHLGEGAFSGVNSPVGVVFWERGRESEGGEACWLEEAASTAGKRSWEAAVLAKLSVHPPAPPRTFADPGVHSGNVAGVILAEENRWGEAGVPIREGKDVQPYRLEAPRLWLWTVPRLPEGGYCRIKQTAFYAGFPILLRQTASRPLAALHREGERRPFRNSCLACRGLPEHGYGFLVALLNSDLLAFDHRERCRDARQRSFPQVKVGALQRLPLRRIGFRTPPERREAQRMEGHQRAVDPKAWEEFLAAAAEDAIHDLLDGMARQVAEGRSLASVRAAMEAAVGILYGLTDEERRWLAEEDQS